MRVRMSKQARADVVSAVTWWRRNLGEGRPIELVAELKRARAQLAATPWAGVSVSKDGRGTRRRLALLGARYFLFYDVDEAKQEVWVLRVWHMSRGQAPKLPRR
ncbi:MAG: hypothetical protein AMXMBFR34_17540 [Myxococcaceae bacterium]